MERICDFRQHSPCMDITAVSCLVIVVAVIVVGVVAVVLVVAVVVKEKEDIHDFR